MKTRRYLLLSVLLTLFFVLVLIFSLLASERYDEILMSLNLGFVQLVLGSWLLTLISWIYYSVKKSSLSALRSYRSLSAVLFIADFLLCIVSILIDGGWKGSSAELIAFYVLPLFLLIFLVLSLIERKKEV